MDGWKKQRWEESEKRREEERRSEKRERDRVWRCAKRFKSRETLVFSDVLWLRRVVARSTLIWNYFGRQHVKNTMLRALLEVEMFKKCTALWRKSTCRSQNVQSTPFSVHFWKLRCWKGARCCGAKHRWKKHHGRSTLRSWDVQKVHAVVARGIFGIQER